MTTHELAALLLDQPNIPCFTYVQEAEEYGETTSVKFYPKSAEFKGYDEEEEDEEEREDDDTIPYSKGEYPTVGEEGIVLIEGWFV